MPTQESIAELARSIALKFQPERIVLFGSFAKGKERSDSDVDLLIVMPYEGKSHRRAIEVLKEIQPEFSVDLLVRTSEEITRRLALNDFFMQDIFRKGKVLYESANA